MVAFNEVSYWTDEISSGRRRLRKDRLRPGPSKPSTKGSAALQTRAHTALSRAGAQLLNHNHVSLHLLD
jgi:hypothetical protein